MDGKKYAVKQLAGFDKWRGLTFVNANGVERFKIPPGTCFSCFQEGHRITQCPVKDSPDARARSRIAKLRKDGIVATPEIAVALPLLNLSCDTTLDKAAALALMVTSGHAHEGDFAHSVADVVAAYRTATAPPSTGKYVLDSGATRHFTTRRADLTDYVPYTSHHPVGGAFSSKGSANGEGTLTLELPGGQLRLEKVMLVPQLGVNLIALNRLMMDGIKVTNLSTTLTLIAPGGKKLVNLELAPTTGVASTLSELPPTRPLERLVVDTWGPSPVRGRLGQRFALLVLDRYSGYAWCVVIGAKDAIPQRLVDLMRRLERETGSSIVELQSDKGTEFVNSTVGCYTASQGIHHRRSVPYVHQNGFVENRFRTLFATPHDLYYGQAAPLEHLRVWGCQAYIALPQDGPRRPHKLAPRAVEARFVGYPASQKGWLFWVPSWGKVVTAWSVARWYENNPRPRDETPDERLGEFALDELEELLAAPLNPPVAAGGGEPVVEQMPPPGNGAVDGAGGAGGAQGAAGTPQEGVQAQGEGAGGAAGQEGRAKQDAHEPPPQQQELEGPARRLQRLAGVDGSTLPAY
ncbi:hypothetical protein JCM9279_003780 [Rhodotorula babjevae]